MRRVKLNRVAIVAAAALLAGAGLRLMAGFDFDTQRISNDAVTQGGEHGIGFTSHELNGAVGEVGGSSITFTSHVLFSGLLHQISFPGTVLDLAAVSKSSTTLSVEWSAPGADGSLGSLQAGSSYFIRASSDAAESWIYSNAQVILGTSSVAPGDPQGASVGGLMANTSYYVRLWTRDPAGNIGALSNGTTDMTLARTVEPLPETFLDVQQSSAIVAWTALPASPSSATSRGYVLEACRTSNFSTLILTTQTANVALSTLTVFGLSSDVTYYFRVGTFNDKGDVNYTAIGSTLTLLSVDTIPPDAIADLSASTMSATSMKLSWSAPFDPTDSPFNGNYRIQHATWTGVEWSTTNAQVAISTSNVNAGDPQSAEVDDLDPNTTYYFKIWAADLKPNVSLESNEAVEMTLAATPSDVHVEMIGLTSATVHWAEFPEAPQSASANGYRLESSTHPDFSSMVVSSVTHSLSPSTLTVTGLTPNSTYYFRAASLNFKDVPNYDDTITTHTLATPPGRLASDFLNVYAASATVRWAALPDAPPAESAAGYLVEASSTGFDGSDEVLSTATVNVALSTLTVSGLLANTTYAFRVGSLNEGGAAAFTLLGSTSSLAGLPTGVSISGVGETSVALAYAAPVDGAEGFRIEASSTEFNGTGAVLSSATLDGTLLTLTVSGLQNDTTYFFRVGSLNWNESPHFAATVATSTLASPPSAIGPDFTAVHFSSITARWAAMQAGWAQGYRLDASSTNFVSGPVHSSTTANVALSTLTVSGLDLNTTYYFRVGSLNWNGTANYTTLASTSSRSAAPLTLASTFTMVGVSSAIAQWSANGNPSGTVYELEFATTANFSGTLISSISANVPLTIEGLFPNATHYVRVRSRNHNNVASDYLALGSTTTLAADPGTASPPFGPVYVTSMTASFTWGTPANPSDTQYTVEISSADDYSVIQTSVTNNSSASFVGLLINTTYYARVKAANRQNMFTEFTVIGATATNAVAPGPVSSTYTSVVYNSLTMTWSSGTAATGYNPDNTSYHAQISLVSNFATVFDEKIVTGLSTNFTGLVANTVYYTRVRTLNHQAIPTTYTTYGSTQTPVSSAPSFLAGTIEVTNSSGQFIDSSLYTNITTPTVRVQVQSNSSPGLAATHTGSMKAIWHLDENTGGTSADSSNYGHTIGLGGASPPSWVPGLMGSALKFNGTNNFSTSTTMPGYRNTVANNIFTVELWFKAGSLDDQGMMFSNSSINTGLTGGTADNQIGWLGGVVVWRLETTSNATKLMTSTQTLDDNQWHYLACVLNASGAYFYIDGTFAASDLTVTNANARTYATLYTYFGMGTRRDSFDVSQFYTGAIDEVRISTVALSLSQIQENYQLGKTLGIGFGAPVVDISTQAGADYTWVRTPASSHQITGADGTTAAQTFTSSISVSGYTFNETQSPGAATNKIRFMASSVDSNVNASAYTILVDTHAPTGTAVSTLVDVSTESITAQWSTGSDALSGFAALPFEVERSTDAAYGVKATSGYISTSSHTFSSLSPNTTYYFHVRSKDNAGNISSFSANAATMTLPVPVQSISVQAVYFSSVTLGWFALPATPASASAHGYRLEASTTNFNGTGVVRSSTTFGVGLSTLTVENLTPNTTTYFRVASFNTIGGSNYAAGPSTSTLANVPTSVSIASVLITTATVSWTAPVYGAEGYRLDASTDSAFNGTLRSSATTSGSATTLSVVDLDPNTTYYLRAGAYNWNNVLSFTTAGSTSTRTNPPSGVTVPTVHITSAAVAWSAPVGGAAGYRVQAATSTEFGGTIESSTTANGGLLTLTVPNLISNTGYYFRVGAINWNNVIAETVQGSTVTLAHPPTAPAFSDVFFSSAQVTWTPAAGTTAGYAVEASTAADFTGLRISSETDNPALSSLAVETLESNTTHYFRVGSLNTGHRGNFSAVFSTGTLAGVATDVNVAEVFPSSLTIAWALPGGGASGFRVEASTASNFTGDVISSATANGGTTALSVESLSTNTTYYFRIASLNPLNRPQYSASVTTATWTELPTAVAVSSVTAASVEVSWNAPAGGASGFRVVASTAGDFTGTVLSSVTSNGATTSLRVGSLDPNTTYYLRVGAVNLNNVPNYSAPVSTSTWAGAASNLVFSGVFISSAALAWDAPSGGASGFVLAASTAADFTGDITSSSTASGLVTALVISPLAPNTTYHFRVGAINNGGVPVYGASRSTSTLANAPQTPAFSTMFLTSATITWGLPTGGAQRFVAQASTAPAFNGTLISSTAALGTSTTISVLGLDPNTTYFFRVGSVNHDDVITYEAAGGTSTLSVPVETLDPSALAVYLSSVTMRWAARPTSPSAASAEGYRLEMSSTNFDGTAAIVSSATAGVVHSTLTATGLLANTTYFARVGTLNWHNAVTYTTLPATSTLAALPLSPEFSTVFVSSLSVTWSSPPTVASGFLVEASTASDFTGNINSSSTANGAATTLTVFSLISQSTYYVRLGSLNWHEMPNFVSVGSTETRSSIDPTAPDAVSNLTATPVTNGSVLLEWSAPADATDNPLDGTYFIQYATWTGVAWSTTAAQITISTSSVDPGDPQGRSVGGLDANTTYYFRLWTQDARPNTSELSNGAMTATLADAPGGAGLADIYDSTATVVWDAFPPTPPSATAEGFRLEASTSSDFTGTVLSSVTTSAAAAALSRSGLDRNTTYFFRIGSLNWNGLPNYAAALSTSTLAPSPTRILPDAIGVFESSVTVRWAALPAAPPAATSEGYALEASTTDFNGTGVVVSSVTMDALQSTMSVAGLQRNTTFYLRVGSRNWNGAPNYTALAATSTLAAAPASAASTYTSVSNTSIAVAWDSNGNADGTRYVLHLSTADDFTGTILSSAAAATTATIEDLTPATSYFARVQAVNHGQIPTAYTVLGSTRTRATPPGAMSPSFSEVAAASVTVQFTSGSPANPDGVVYEIQLSVDAGFGAATSSATVLADAVFSALTPNTTVYARGRANNGVGDWSSFTDFASTVTWATPPVSVVSTFTNIASRSMSVNWSSGTASIGFNSAETMYTVQLSTASDFSGDILQIQTTALAANFGGLDPGTLYYARAKATNALNLNTVFTGLGSETTLPTSEVEFQGGTFEITNAAGTYIDPSLYTDTTTPNIRVDVQSRFAPGLAVEDTPSHLLLWHLDDGAGGTGVDASLHNHDAVLKGTPLPTWTGGKLGGALDFDGSQNHAVSNNLTPWRANAGANVWTVEMWFKSSSNVGYLFQAANVNSGLPSSFDLDIGWHNTSGNLAFSLRTTGGVQKIAEGASSYADGGWHHVAAVLNSAGMYLYVDGSLSGSNTTITASTAKTYATAIYAWVGAAVLLDSNIGNGSKFTTAIVDEVRISTVAYTAQQVAQSHALTGTRGIGLGGPAINVSTTSGSDFTWVRLSTANTSVSGTNGSTAIETFSGTSVSLIESAGPAADTNQVMFLTTSIDGNLTTAQYTILVDTTPPAGAAISSLVGISSASVTVNAQAASDGVSGLAALPYNIEASTDASFAVAEVTGFIAGLSPSFSDLMPNSTYYFHVQAKDAAGNISGFSSNVSTVTLAKPLDDAAVFLVHSTSVTINWTALPVSPASATAAGYVVHASTAADFTGSIYSSATTNAALDALSVIDLSMETTYYFRAATLNWRNVPTWSTAGSTRTYDRIAPDPVADLAAAPSATGGAVDLAWSAPGDNGSSSDLFNSSFTIQYTTDTAFANGSAWSPTAALPDDVYRITIATDAISPASTVGTTVTGLAGGATYYFRLWTRDHAGNHSALSNGATAWATDVSLDITLSTDTLNFGSLLPGATVVHTSSVTITNAGNVTMRFGISVTDPVVWRSTPTGAGIDTFRLTGVFRETQPTANDFDVANDVITTSTTTATAAAYAVDAEADNEKGFNVAPNESRTIWFRIEMPPISSTTDEQILRLRALGQQ